MKKIPTLFMRDDERRVLNTVHPDCGWVIDGEGWPTLKLDGACCMIDRSGRFWRRRVVKKGKGIPDRFFLIEHDEATGKTVGWVPISWDAPEDKYFMEGRKHLAEQYRNMVIPAGTYELVGPKVQGNAEGRSSHHLTLHADLGLDDADPDIVPRTFDELREWLEDEDIEGIVWHHPNGRMAKIKKRDFGMER